MIDSVLTQIILILLLIIIIVIIIITVIISNGNRTEWSTIQGVIGRLISNQADLKLRA